MPTASPSCWSSRTWCSRWPSPIAPMSWKAAGSPCPARRASSLSIRSCARVTWAIESFPPHFKGEECLNSLARRPAARPGPLEVVAAEPAGNVDRLAYHEQTGDLARFQGARREFVGIDAAQGDLGLGVALGAG